MPNLQVAKRSARLPRLDLFGPLLSSPVLLPIVGYIAVMALVHEGEGCWLVITGTMYVFMRIHHTMVDIARRKRLREMYLRERAS